MSERGERLDQALTTTHGKATIGVDIERRRLEHRAHRIEFTIAALSRLADTRAPDGPVPVPLREAIVGFSRELAELDRRLTDL